MHDTRDAGARAMPPAPAWMLPLLATALLVRLFFVFVGPFFIRPDEVFQALEPAHRLLTGRGVITWEWHEGIRSWLLPGLIAALMQASAWLGLGHSILAVQCVFATLSLAVVAVAVRFGQVFAGPNGALFCGVLTAFWPDTVLDGAHTLSESQGGNLLAVATMLAAIALRRRSAEPPGSQAVGRLRRAAFGIGVLLGLAAILRFQLAPGIAVVLVASLLADPRRRGAPMLAGAVLPLAGQAVLDTLTLGTPLQSIWKNLAVNLGEHRADLFGTSSPVFFLGQMVQYWGAALLPLAACFVRGFGSARLAGLVAVAVVLSHSLIAHKEWSFIAGAIPLVLVVAGVGAARVLERVAPPTRPWRSRLPLASWIALGIAAMSLMSIFDGYRPMRRENVGLWRVMADAHAMPGLCGLALYVGASQWWIWSGGYSLLDRDVPLYLLRTKLALARSSPGFNALVVTDDMLGSLPSDYAVAKCLHGACLLRRPGPCIPTASHLIQDETGLGLPIQPGSVHD